MKICTFLILALTCAVFSETEISETEKINKNLETIINILDKSPTEKPCQSGYIFHQPSSCAELFLQGVKESGIYTIYPRPWFRRGPWFKKSTLQVYCDMETDGGGWTVFQRRADFEPRENFFRNWADYRKGFGDLEKEFWLGNDNLYMLTNQDYVTLRVDLEDFEGNVRYALYKKFRVADWQDKFRAEIGDYGGDAGDGLIHGHRNATFVTYDHEDINNCAQSHKGAWWYTFCHASNLNGQYLKGNHSSSYADGVNWYYFKGHHYSLKTTEMKIRPSTFLAPQ